MPAVRETFDKNMAENHALLMDMFKKVHAAYTVMFTMLEDNDKETAKTLIDNDRTINALETRINEHAFLTILKQCPVAKDLRTLMTSIKVANDLERLADYVVNVGVYLLKTEDDNRIYRNLLHKYQGPLLAMFEKISEAYDNTDVELAFRVCEMDSAVDAIYQEQIERFINVTREKTDVVAAEAGRALLVIKQLERAGDHITNIAEHLIFLQTGKQLKLN